MRKAVFGCMRPIRELISAMGLPLLAPVRSYLQSGASAQRGSDRGDRGAVRTIAPLGSSCLQPRSLTCWTCKARTFSFCNPQRSCRMFQCFKVNANIDVSLASTPRESFARVQGRSHCTATLPVFDKLTMLCSFVWVPNCYCQKVRYAEYQTLWEKYNDNDKSTISAEQHLKIQLRIPKKRRTRVRRNRHSPTTEKHRW